LQTALWWASEKEPDCGEGINWYEFIKDLNIKPEENVIENNSNEETKFTLTH